MKTKLKLDQIYEYFISGRDVNVKNKNKITEKISVAR